jgi:hypothetical protein
MMGKLFLRQAKTLPQELDQRCIVSAFVAHVEWILLIARPLSLTILLYSRIHRWNQAS